MDKNIIRHTSRAAITDRSRNDIYVFRKLISFQVSADDLIRKVAVVFHRLGISDVRNQFDDSHKMIGSWGGGERNLLNVQTVCVAVRDTASMLIFSCARPVNPVRFHVRNHPSSLEIDSDIYRLFQNFLSALEDAFHEKDALDSVRMTVVGDVKILAIRTLQGLPCTAFLTSDMAIFTDPATGRAFCVWKDRAGEEIVFQMKENSFFHITTESNLALVSGVRLDFSGYKGVLLDWMPPRSKEAMKKSIRGWGGSLVLWGALCILIPDIFDYRWGICLIVLGILNLLIAHRFLFIANGLMMMAVGIWNFAGTIAAGSSNVLWAVVGFSQIGWGVKELLEFSKYRNVKDAEENNA